jgi:hypothetical protein
MVRVASEHRGPLSPLRRYGHVKSFALEIAADRIVATHEAEDVMPNEFVRRVLVGINVP